MKPENYFDNAATTPVDPRVVREMLPYFETHWGNANSLHAWGRDAMVAVDQARERVAQMLGTDPSLILFTSGATESNNWIFHIFKDIAISPFEHAAMYEPAQSHGAQILKNEGLKISPPSEKHKLISVMTVNNEIGTIWNPADFSELTRFLHSDITQAAGKLGLKVDGLFYASFSAHKFYGPKGVGGLFTDDGAAPAFILGGEQQYGRGGTLNVPGIVGMGAASAIALDEWQDNLAKTEELRAIVLEALGPCKDYRINGGDNVSPYILSVSFLGLEGETLVIEMDQKGFGISSGAACSSRSTDPSHVLMALKTPMEWLRGTIRISFGRLNTKDSARALGKALVETVERLRNLRTI